MDILRVLLIPLAVFCAALAILTRYLETRWSFGFALAAAILSGVALLWTLVEGVR